MTIEERSRAIGMLEAGTSVFQVKIRPFRVIFVIQSYTS